MLVVDIPAWASEPVRLEAHDPAWAPRAREYAAKVAGLFAGHLTSEVLHVGSTAVPGLPAKPIVDLQALTAEPDTAVASVGSAAVATGWMPVPRELDRRPWRRLLVRVDATARHRLAHLNLMPPGQERWDAQLRFRDRLRADPDLRAEYAALKERSAADHPDDREAYTRAEEAFVRRAVGGP